MLKAKLLSRQEKLLSFSVYVFCKFLLMIDPIAFLVLRLCVVFF